MTRKQTELEQDYYTKSGFELEKARVDELESHLDDEVKRLSQEKKERRFPIPGNPSLYMGLALLLFLFIICLFP